MAKTKTPFLSLGARGSVGSSITAQKRASSTLVRKKPIPTYRNTLPIQYQRWLYEDYAYLWRQQSAATRQQYAAAGSRHHLTGFQYWMKYQLINLPDIVGYWKLDDNLGITTMDSSRNQNTLSVVGPSPTTGLINKCFEFDGLNDRLVTPFNLKEAVIGSLPRTIECFFKDDDITSIGYTFSYGPSLQGQQCGLVIHNAPVNGTLWFIGTNANFTSTLIATQSKWHYACIQVINNLSVLVQLDNTEELGVPTNPLSTTASPFFIGTRFSLSQFLKGKVDQAVFYNRLLDKATRDRHSLRRFSL